MGNRDATRALLAGGVVGPPLFFAVFLIDGATRAGYDPWRHWISHLSLGERGWLGITNLILFGLLMLGFASGLRRVVRSGSGPTWGPRLISLFGLGLVLSGMFTIDPGLGYPPGAPSQNPITWHGRVHDLAGALVFGSMAAACFILARRFAKDLDRRGWTLLSILAGTTVAASFAACSVLASLDYAGVLSGAPSGAFERASIAAGGAWISLLALRLSRETEVARTTHSGYRLAERNRS